VQALYACFSPALSSAVGGALRSLREPTYRLYNCRRCGLQVRICSRCDHGNIYCAGECARIRRRESVRRAGARYQRGRRGAHRHAARQRTWRTRRRREVTHQGCPSGGLYGSVSENPISTLELTDAEHRSDARTSLRTSDEVDRCSFCGAPLPHWTRPRRWYWSG
jgi:hypothetical protein